MELEKQYIGKVDQNISEAKQDLRDTESRISEMINKHIDYTIHLDEERHKEILQTNDKIDQSVVIIDRKIDSVVKKIDTTNKWIMGLVITCIVAVAFIALLSQV